MSSNRTERPTTSEGFEIPRMPPLGRGRRYLRVTERAWRALWSAPHLQAEPDPCFAVLIERYIVVLDQWHRAMRSFRGSPLIKGSKGQPVLNPLWRRLNRLEMRTREIEKALAMSPLDRKLQGLPIDGRADDLEGSGSEADGGEIANRRRERMPHLAERGPRP